MQAFRGASGAKGPGGSGQLKGTFIYFYSSSVIVPPTVITCTQDLVYVIIHFVERFLFRVRPFFPLYT